MNKPGMYLFKTLVSPWSFTPWFNTQIYLKLFSKPRLQLVPEQNFILSRI